MLGSPTWRAPDVLSVWVPHYIYVCVCVEVYGAHAALNSLGTFMYFVFDISHLMPTRPLPTSTVLFSCLRIFFVFWVPRCQCQCIEIIIYYKSYDAITLCPAIQFPIIVKDLCHWLWGNFLFSFLSQIICGLDFRESSSKERVTRGSVTAKRYILL